MAAVIWSTGVKQPEPLRSRVFLDLQSDGFYYAFNSAGPWHGPYTGKSPYAFKEYVRKTVIGRQFSEEWINRTKDTVEDLLLYDDDGTLITDDDGTPLEAEL